LKYFYDKYCDFIETKETDVSDILKDIMTHFKSSSDLALGT